MEENDDVLPNQVGKPVKNPTVKWIAELMNIIAVVSIKTGFGIQRIVTNVKTVISHHGTKFLLINVR